MRAPLLLAATVALGLAACSESSDEVSSDEVSPDGATPTTDEVTTASDDEAPTTQPPTTQPPTTQPPTTEPATTEPPAPTLPPPAPWDQARFDEAIEPTMAALAVGVGQPLSAAAVAPEIVLPDGVPSPGGTVSGAGWVSDFDPFRDAYELEYAVGLDQTITPDELFAWQTELGDADNGWRAPSFAESGSFFTSLVIDEADQRLVHVLDTDAPGNGRPPLNLEWSPTTTTILDPDWLASLPRPEGGVTTEVSVARGDVTVGLGGAGFDGQVFARFDYTLDDVDRMIEYFESGVLIGAGFEYEPEPISNSRYRRDVTIGDWSGEVLIGNASTGDVDYVQVVWQLTRGAE